TSATQPVLRSSWLASGCHLNAISFPGHDLPADIVADCVLFADRRESLESEARDWREGLARGLFGPDHLPADLGPVLTGQAAGRTSSAERTLFRSLGLAAEDLAAAELTVEKALAAGDGATVRR